MKILVSLCFVLLVTLSNSRYFPFSWGRCPGGPDTWNPLYVQVTQDPNLKQVLTFSANGFVENVPDHLDFQTLLVNGSVGANYTWNNTSPYVRQNVKPGFFALNYTTSLPSLNEARVEMRMNALDLNGNELACIKFVLKNTTEISI